MSSRTADKTRLIRITAGNLRNDHIYLTGHHDFFPEDCFGPPRKSANGQGVPVTIQLDGMGRSIETDIGREARTGKPRKMFRGRRWVRAFFQAHEVTEGDTLALERTGNRRYRLSVAERIEHPATSTTFTAAEFFAGIGLVRLALERQGWEVVLANDLDPKKAEMYQHNWPKDDHFLLDDIHKLDAADIPQCDLYTASFPCNDLSIAGRWDGLNGKESSAFWGLIRILREKGNERPRLVLLENVVGFLMRHKGRDFEKAMIALNELGYTVDALILNARHWTPQSRARLFVVARLNDDEDRQTLALKSDVRPDSLVEFINTHQNIRWGLRDLPSLPEPTARLVDILEDLPKNDPHWWSEERADYFVSQFSPKHEEFAQNMIKGRSYSYATAFRRVRHGKSMAELRTDGIAGCLRTPRGGSGRQILFKAGRGKYQVRLLTARECARLQGVPENYQINVGLNQALFGFGDAVCVPVVEWIAKHSLNSQIETFANFDTSR